MATHFQKAFIRNLWLGVATSYVIDASVLFLLISLLSPQAPAPLLWALGIPIAIYVIQFPYGAYTLAKRYAFYRLFEKERRIDETVAEFKRLRLPEPEPYYNDADEYLTKAANDENLSAEARFSCAVTLGMLSSQRQFGPRREALLTNVILEEAIARYGRTHIPFEG